MEQKIKNKILALLIIFLTGFSAYLLSGSELFIGALFVDSKIESEKMIAYTTNREQDVLSVKTEETGQTLKCEVVVAGAGTGGYAAALASAREGADTCLIEETDWLGGMLTTAGVSAIDGRPDSASGIFQEIIENIELYYSILGKTHEIHNCTVSYLCFEPSVGNKILNKIAAKEKNLRIFFNSKVNKVYMQDDKVTGVRFKQNEKTFIVDAKVTIDATEFGDLMYLGNIDYDLGPDPESDESLANQADECIQPLTYVAILKKYQTPSIIERPKNYNRNNYRCTIAGPACPTSNSLFDMDRMLSYGRMPGNKLMINIPSHSYGNDFHATAKEYEPYNREQIYEEAKNYSRGFIYFLQTELGMQNYVLHNEFNTADKFAKMPYVRESRRLKGVYRLTEHDIVKAGGGQRADLQPDAIAIGDYPIDLHFCSYGKGDIFKPIAPYQIPYGVTIPEKVGGFMAADKNISVSHIANGTTRLQPVTMAVGQAVGTAAAMSVKQEIEPRQINVKELQYKLIEDGANLFFFKDTTPQHFAYKHIVKLAINGYLSGYADFTFKPNEPISLSELLKVIEVYLKYNNFEKTPISEIKINGNTDHKVLRKEIVDYLYSIILIEKNIFPQKITPYNVEDVKKGSDLYHKLQILANIGVINDSNTHFRPNEKLTRAEAVVLLDRVMDAVYQ